MALDFYLATENNCSNFRLTTSRPPSGMEHPLDLKGTLEQAAETYRTMERDPSNGDVVLRYGVSPVAERDGYGVPSPDQKARFDSYRRSLSSSLR